MSGINPAELAQMDREKALWDGKLTELVSAYRDFIKVEPDGSRAFFELMEDIANVDGWKLAAALACAVHRLADTPGSDS